MKKFAIFGMRIRYENLKNIGLCFIAFCLFQADGYAFEAGPLSFMSNSKIQIAAQKLGLYDREWVEIKNADYPVFISNKGDIISFGRYDSGYLIRPCFRPNFYPVVTIRINGIKRARLLHRLLAECFIPNPDNKPQVNHIDGDKWNYSLDNLEWVTDQENKIHAHKSGLINIKRNSDCRLSKPIIQLTKTGEFVREWPCTEEIIRVMKFDGPHIRQCANGIRKSANGFKWAFK